VSDRKRKRDVKLSVNPALHAHTCPPRADIPCPECGLSSNDRDRLIEIVAKTLRIDDDRSWEPETAYEKLPEWRKAAYRADAAHVVDALELELLYHAFPEDAPEDGRGCMYVYRIRALEDG